MRSVFFVLFASGCFLHHQNLEAYNAVIYYQNSGTLPSCGYFYEGQQLPNGAVVDQMEGQTVVLIVPDTQSAEGENDHLIPCSK